MLVVVNSNIDLLADLLIYYSRFIPVIICFYFFFINNNSFFIFFFFQAEDGIRDATVTGVQTCALPICQGRTERPQPPPPPRFGGQPRAPEIAAPTMRQAPAPAVRERRAIETERPQAPTPRTETPRPQAPAPRAETERPQAPMPRVETPR